MEHPDRSTDPEGYREWRNTNTTFALDYIKAQVEDMRFKIDSGEAGQFSDDVKMTHWLAGLGNLVEEMVHFYKHEVQWVAKQAVEDVKARKKYGAMAEDIAPHMIAEIEQFLSADDRPGD